jgi:hypothetical protein
MMHKINQNGVEQTNAGKSYYFFLYFRRLEFRKLYAIDKQCKKKERKGVEQP